MSSRSFWATFTDRSDRRHSTFTLVLGSIYHRHSGRVSFTCFDHGSKQVNLETSKPRTSWVWIGERIFRNRVWIGERIFRKHRIQRQCTLGEDFRERKTSTKNSISSCVENENQDGRLWGITNAKWELRRTPLKFTSQNFMTYSKSDTHFSSKLVNRTVTVMIKNNRRLGRGAKTDCTWVLCVWWMKTADRQSQ
jgi:hypothetical protein